MSDFSDPGVVGKLALPSLLKFGTCTEASLGLRDTVLRIEVVGEFSMPGVHFPIEIPV